MAMLPEQKTKPLAVTTACGKMVGMGFGALVVTTDWCEGAAMMIVNTKRVMD